jgi:hypothetical protein
MRCPGVEAQPVAVLVALPSDAQEMQRLATLGCIDIQGIPLWLDV